MNQWYCLLEREPVGVIYGIRCLVNGKFYIGQTTDPTKRRSKHYKQQNCPKLKNAMRKHGIEKFVWGIIEFCSSRDELDRREIELINKFDSVNNGYNLAGGGRDGAIVSEETKQKMREISTRRMADPEARKNISEKNKGRKLSSDTKIRMSLAKLGQYKTKPVSDSTKKLMSEYQKGRRRSENELNRSCSILVQARTNFFESIRYEVTSPDGDVTIITRESFRNELPRLIERPLKQIQRAMYHHQKINGWLVKHKCRKKQT